MGFPTSPSNGDYYTNALGTLYQYISTDDKWIIVSYKKAIPQSKFIGSGGFINAVWFGGCLTVLTNDPNAGIHSSFYVEEGGDFKILIAFTEGTNAGRVAGGVVSWCKDVDLGVITWDVENQEWDLTLAALNILNIDIFPTIITIADNSRVGVRWVKDDACTPTPGAGFMIIYGMWLIRQ